MSLTPNDLKSGDQLILVLTFELNAYMRNHIEYVIARNSLASDLLLLTHGQSLILNHNTFETDMSGVGMLVATTKLAKKKFESAWDAYVTRYDWNPELEAIPVLQTNHINGYMVEHTRLSTEQSVVILASSPPVKFKDEFEWIMNNTTGKVWWTKLFWLFENEADAALFKLQK